MDDDTLEHIGIKRRSGRYPWGSGENPFQHEGGLYGYIQQLKKSGLTESEVAEALGVSVRELRAMNSYLRAEKRAADAALAYSLKEKGWSNAAIGREMGINESSVRSLLDPALRDKAAISLETAKTLEKALAEHQIVDIGAGVAQMMGISDAKLDAAVSLMQTKGYKIQYIQVEQLGTGNMTTIKVLVPEDMPYSEAFKLRDKIGLMGYYSEDGGRTYLGIEKPSSISSKRLQVLYDEDGGSERDGLIEIRRGAKDLSMGSASYAQVRIAIDGTHYVKGMAIYVDDLPDGVDIRFNTNKSKAVGKKGALKELKDDPDNPFGATIKRQNHYLDASGKSKLGAVNIVNEEGDWGNWSKSISSQVLSKQKPSLAKRQLDLAYERRLADLQEIQSLTNPSVKRKMLMSFADSADSAAVHLKAAALPRQATHVLLPFRSLKSNEIYAPNYKNGEKVVLIRYPHGGIFEIPELTVNNRNSAVRRVLGNARDAVGINSKVASRLSGADFDGDTVLVIPNGQGRIKTSPALKGLKGFDPQRAYPAYKGMPKLKSQRKQMLMGDVSNLITDMTIRGASQSELARAVRHSMVVIDAEKHNLNYKQSYIDNGISALKQKYQGSSKAGASTLISRASSQTRVADRSPRRMSKGGPIDKSTGRKVYEYTGATYTDKRGKTKKKTQVSTKMAETSDARKLSSGTVMESVYATHANRMKALALTARKQAVNTKSIAYSPSARKTYATEVASLRAKLNTALKNKPLERKAQSLANATVSRKRASNPDMGKDEVKRLKAQALAGARTKVGAKKTPVTFTDREWRAVQAGAVSSSFLEQLLSNTTDEHVKSLSMPKKTTAISSAKRQRAKSLSLRGYTQAEIAEALGISASSVSTILNG